MPVILKNNAFSTLATAITASDTGVVVANGSQFPTIAAGEYFYVTLVSQAGQTEIVKVTARVGNSMTVVRAQDGSSAASFQIGTLVDMRVNVASVLDSNGDYTTFDTVSLLLADTTLTYTTVSAGDVVQTRTEGFAYVVAASAATDQHVTTAGGVKLYVLAGANGYDVKAFGAVGDGVADDTVALQKAVTVSTGQSFYVPTGTYLLSANVLGDLTQVQNMAPGVTFSGFGVFNCAIFEVKSNGQSRRLRRGLPGDGAAVGEYERYLSTGTGGAYGRRTDFFQQGVHTSSFSIGHGVVSDFDGTNGAYGLASWLVAATPVDPTKTFGVVGEEVNPINIAIDMGYRRKRGEAARWTGGIQVVPEAKNITRGGPNIGRNTTFGFAVTPSNESNDLGIKVKTYTGFLAEENSIGPEGRAFSAQGAATAVDLPLYGLQIDANWQAGIDTRNATLSTGRALTMAAGQSVQWGTTSFPPSVNGDNATGTLDFAVAGATNFQVALGAAGVVNFLAARGNATGGRPSITAEGADTNIGLTVEAKGTGGIFARTNGAIALQVSNVASAVNYLNIFGNATGARPTISAVGADANIDLAITPKGTGYVTFGTRTASSDVAVTGYVEIKDAGGTVRRLAVVG